MIVYLVNRNSKFKGPFDIIDSNRQHIIRVGDICLRDTNNGLSFLVVVNSENSWNACKRVGVGSNSKLLELGNTLLFSFDGLHKRIGNIPLINQMSGCFREKVIVDFLRNAIDILEYKTDFWDASLFLQFFASSQVLLDYKKEIQTNPQAVSVKYPTLFAQYLKDELLLVLNEKLAQGKSLKEIYELIRDQNPSSFRTSLVTFLLENPSHTIYDKPAVAIEPVKIEQVTSLIEIQHEVIVDEYDLFRLSNEKKQELQNLFNRYHNGDKKAFDKIVQDNQKLVALIANSFKGRRVEYDDLIQEGSIGLMKAIDHYDDNYNVEFSKYAQWWIRRAMIQALITLPQRVKVPQNVLRDHSKVWNFIKEFEQQYEIPPAVDEINIHEIDRERTNYVYNLPSNINDLTSLVEDLDIFESDDNTFESIEDKEYFRYKANVLLSTFKKRERLIVKSYFGIGCFPKSLEEIGKGLHLTRERVRQILFKTIKILRERAKNTGPVVNVLQKSTPQSIADSFETARIGSYIEVPESKRIGKVVDIRKQSGVVRKIVIKVDDGKLFYYTPDGVLYPVSNETSKKTSPEREAFLKSMESQKHNTIEIASRPRVPQRESKIIRKTLLDGKAKERKSLDIKQEKSIQTKKQSNNTNTYIIDTNILSHIFQNTSATYKFYWFISIMQLLQQSGNPQILVYDIVARMVANAWPPLICHNLEFGHSDSLNVIVKDIQRYNIIPINTHVEQIYAILKGTKKEYRIKRLLRVLTWNVPYRFLSPWINTSNNKDLMKRSQHWENGCLYSLYMDENEPYIQLNSQWKSYLSSHYEELLAFSYKALSTFLLPKNPEITNIEQIISLYDDTSIREGQNNQVNNKESIDDLKIEHVYLDKVDDNTHGSINIEEENVSEQENSEPEFDGIELAKRFYYPAQDFVFWDCNHQVYEIYLVDNYDLVINHLLFDYDELFRIEKDSKGMSVEAKEELFSKYWDNNHINVIARIKPGSNGYETLEIDAGACIQEIQYIEGQYTSIKLVNDDGTKYFDYNGNERESFDDIINNVIRDVARYHVFYDAPYYVIKEYIRFKLFEIKHIYKGTIKKVTIYADSELGQVIKNNSEEIWKLDEALILTKKRTNAENCCSLKAYFINGVEIVNGDFDSVRAKSILLQNQLKERTVHLWKTFKKKKEFIRYGRQIKEIAATLFEYAEDTSKENKNFPVEKGNKVNESDVIKVVETKNSDEDDERDQSIDEMEIEHVYLDEKGNVIINMNE